MPQTLPEDPEKLRALLRVLRPSVVKKITTENTEVGGVG